MVNTLPHALRTISRRTPGPAILLASALLFGGAVLHAQTLYTWNNSGGGEFLDSDNWTPNGQPGSGDTASFQRNSPGYTVTFDDDVRTGLRVDNDNVTLSLDGNTFTVETDAWAGVDNAINLMVENGSLESNAANLLFLNSGSGGTLTFVSATWNTGTGTQTSLVTEGTGTVQIHSGSTVIAQTGGGMYSLGLNSGSNGTLNIDGTGSMWDGRGTAPGTVEQFRLTGDSGAEATLNITNGGVFHHRGQISTGGGDAQATVSGAGSLLQTDDRLLIENNTTNSSLEFTAQNGGRIVVLDENNGGSRMRDGQFGIEGVGSSIEISGGLEFLRGNLRVQLDGAMAGDTLMTVGGDLIFADPDSFSNNFILELAPGFSTEVGTVFNIFAFGGDRLGEDVFSNLADGGLVSIGDYVFQADYGGMNDSVFTLTAIPEPGTLMLLGIAAITGLLGCRLRRS